MLKFQVPLASRLYPFSFTAIPLSSAGGCLCYPLPTSVSPPSLLGQPYDLHPRRHNGIVRNLTNHVSPRDAI
ncbi:hypothetical protein F4818DRAFT_417155 [Hypoxylon cercidicola]|nr:hypothetical protein F4818DRAFT_417155 [Hypoxylon cercidicola]